MGLKSGLLGGLPGGRHLVLGVVERGEQPGIDLTPELGGGVLELRAVRIIGGQLIELHLHVIEFFKRGLQRDLCAVPLGDGGAKRFICLRLGPCRFGEGRLAAIRHRRDAVRGLRRRNVAGQGHAGQSDDHCGSE